MSAPNPTKDAKAKTEPKPTESNGGGVGFSLPLVLIVIVVAFVAGTQTAKLEARRLSVNATVGLPVTPTLFEFPGDKYESEVVEMIPRRVLNASLSCEDELTVLEKNVNVETVLGQPEAFRRDNKVLLMLNGHNNGVVLRWSKKTGDKCLYSLAETAATVLGADPDFFPNGLRLYNSMGIAIASADELDAERLAYILVDFQIWVWPGIRVGYRRIVNGMVMTTLSLAPIVYDVEGFFSAEEADAIINHGMINLKRSSVAQANELYATDSTRTSHTAFLDDNQFTRNFRVRGANLTRLPSPSFIERAQLVRYEAGQFFRRHEDYFHNKKYLDEAPGQAPLDKYKTWCDFANAHLITSPPDDAAPDVLPGGPLFPRFQDKFSWEHALLQLFLEKNPDYFKTRGITEWGIWLNESLKSEAVGIMEQLLDGLGHILPDIIKAWEDHAVSPKLHFKNPKPEVNGVSHYFRWIRWAKDRIAALGDKAPANVQSSGTDYPSFELDFQNQVSHGQTTAITSAALQLASYILDDHSLEELEMIISPAWAAWLDENADTTDIIVNGAKTNTKIFELAVESWTRRAGPDLFTYTMPTQMQHAEPNRFLTLFLYLNDVDEGGETVFPYSAERLVTDIKREGMDECSEGLAVPPLKLHSALFYSQTWDNQVDPMSNHGGCPPAKGVKYGANLFTWNVDADEGASALGF
ncbi:unnamed protein product [Aphanomyces euteiches]